MTVDPKWLDFRRQLLGDAYCDTHPYPLPPPEPQPKNDSKVIDIREYLERRHQKELRE
jgi:hypothetical protein